MTQKAMKAFIDNWLLDEDNSTLYAKEYEDVFTQQMDEYDAWMKTHHPCANMKGYEWSCVSHNFVKNAKKSTSSKFDVRPKKVNIEEVEVEAPKPAAKKTSRRIVHSDDDE
jgi:hypothetical protein